MSPRYVIIEHAGWREPIIGAVEECYDDTVEATGRRSYRHILSDAKQFEHLKRLADGTACGTCLEVFPERPGPDSVKAFRDVYEKPGQLVPWRERVMAGCCPMCGNEVSTEFFEALHEGVLPTIPDIEETP